MPARETVSLLSTGAASAAHSTHVAGSAWLGFLVLAAVVLVIVLVQNQKHKKVSSKHVRMAFRLAALAAVSEQAFINAAQEKDEQAIELFEFRENLGSALECGKTLIFDPCDVFGVGGALRNRITAECEKTMFKCMDMTQIPSWMRWKYSSALFAVRAWGLLLWKQIFACIIEVVATGSCGLNGGKDLVQQLFQKTGCEGIVYVLKALSGSERFWTSQGFHKVTYESDIECWQACPAD